MLIGFVLTLARRKVQANADAGGEMGKEEELGGVADETWRELRLLLSLGTWGGE